MKIKGLQVEPGIVIDRVTILKQKEFDITKQSLSDIQSELDLFHYATHHVISDITHLKQLQKDPEILEIMDAHIALCNDIEIEKLVHKNIQKGYTAAYSYNKAVQYYLDIFEQMNDAYIKERITDIKDVSKRVLQYLLDIDKDQQEIKGIIISDMLTPSELWSLDQSLITGIILLDGSLTSHTAIICKSYQIPTIIIEKAMFLDEDINVCVLNSVDNYIIINPTNKEAKEEFHKQELFQQSTIDLQLLKDQPTKTKDQKGIALACNITSTKELDYINDTKIDGVGLFRTEFLFIDRDKAPSEEEQITTYKQVLDRFKDKPVLLRTLDIGGDKQLSFLPKNEELLGLRGLRFSLSEQSLLTAQIRAMLQANHHGNLHIMLPMVETIDDLHEAKQLIENIKINLQKENKLVNNNFRFGIMVEVPQIIETIEDFAKEVDFCSIGTNDLYQFTFGLNRFQAQSSTHNLLDKEFLVLLQKIVQGMHQHHKWVGMCGNMASDKTYIKALIGLELDELSVPISEILRIRKEISETDTLEAKMYLEELLK